MKKDYKELAGMFDIDLEPSKKFEKQLRNKLVSAAKPKHRFLPWKRIALAGSALAILGVLGLSLYRPNPSPTPGPVARNVLLRSLYQSAFAAPVARDITFWKMKTTWGGGPKADACQDRTAEGLGATADDRNSYDTELELFFKQGSVTASLEKMVDTSLKAVVTPAYYEPSMAYSQDPARPAFEDKAFFGNMFEPFMQLKDEVVLTDARGVPLSMDAATAQKDSGTYELYSRASTERLGGDYGECRELFGHIVVDAKTNLLVSGRAYMNEASEENLVWYIDRELETASGDFESVRAQFEAEGYNQRQAEEYIKNLPDEYWQQ